MNETETTLLTAEDYLRFPVVEPDHRYSYGEDSQQFGELYLPASDPPHRTIILIHGGGYRAMYDLKPMGSVARALADDGFAVWNIEYRRAGNGGDFPQMFLDVAAAADHLRRLADRHSLALDSVLSVGHSAGGHLALWLAGRHKAPPASPLYAADSLPIAGAVALAPIADIRFAVEKKLSSEALLQVMGGDAQVAPENYRAGSPRELLPLGSPQAHIVGTEDAAIMNNVKVYLAAARSAGDKAQLIEAPRVGHFEIVSTGAPAFRTVRETICNMHAMIKTGGGD
ncbi:MAG: alpha/beta hydrolase [Chloroflexota bacterium]|nr:alpha/beta hydrolase [Chloroflexota bacterium]MDE2951671.1 alpha/beta hydrolase [Chloroflexota bacterium]